jgi:hypothetical protein
VSHASGATQPQVVHWSELRWYPDKQEEEQVIGALQAPP